MIVSQKSLPFRSNRVSLFLFALIVLPLGIANAEEDKKDWSAERQEYVERIKELTREIEELRYEGKDNWAKHLEGRRDHYKGALLMLDEILKLEQSDQAAQFKDKLEVLADRFWRTERIGEMEGRLSELKVEKDELADSGEEKARRQVEVFIADQEKLLKLIRDLHKIAETDDDRRIETLEKQLDQREESLLLRIEEFHLKRHMVGARQDGEDVRDLEAELEKVRKALRELTSDSN